MNLKGVIKINVSQVSKRVGITSAQTIWYYIDLGLIVPNKQNGRYNFSEQDIEELKIIKKLKSYKFSLEEIHKIISLYRCSYLISDRDLKEYIYFFKDKKESINNEIIELQKSIEGIDEIIVKAEENAKNSSKVNGINICFLPFFSCPNCKKPLQLCDAYIQNNQVNKGHLECSCGYNALIIDGMLVCSHKDDNQDDLTHSLLSQYDAKAITSIQKIANILNDKLTATELTGKLILETTIDRFFYLLKNINNLNENALYIVVDPSPETIQFYKKQFDQMDFNRNILFIVSDDFKLPILNECIDIWVDYFDSTMFSSKRKELLHFIVQPYLKNGAKIFGGAMNVSHNASYLKLYKEEYQNMNIEDFMDNNFFANIKKGGFDIKIKEQTDFFLTPEIKVRDKIKNVKDLIFYYEAIYKKQT